MTTLIQHRQDPSAVLIVYGRDISGIPRASWFKAEDRAAAIDAAQLMKLAALELKTDDEKALAIGIHEGVLKGSGRMIVGSASPEAFRRIEDHVRKSAGSNPGAKNDQDDIKQPMAPSPATNASPASAPSPQGAVANPSAAPAPSAALNSPWASLRVGSTVLAAYWNEEKEIEGWWPAIITRADDNEFRLRWRDTTEYALGRVKPKHIAILHPEFLASGK